MSVRTGVFTKYVVQFKNPDLTISNDPSIGDFVLDADITVTMSRWTEGTTFKIVLYDLPLAKATDIQNARKSGTYSSLKIQLGYLDTEVKPVIVDGIYGTVESKQGDANSPGQNRQVTTISGNEQALVACNDTKFTGSLKDDAAASYAKAAQSVLASVFTTDNKAKHAGIENLLSDKVLINAPLSDDPSPSRFHNNKVLTILDEIARKAQAELLVSDKTVFLGKPIKRTDVDPALLDPTTNLAKFESKTYKTDNSENADDSANTDAPANTGAGQKAGASGTVILYFSFTSLGDPTMRPGQTIKVTGVDKFSSSQEFIVRYVEHQFSASTGYVCVGAAAGALADGAAARNLDSQIKPSASGAAQNVAGAIKLEAAKNPAVEVTSVKGPADNGKYPYQADLYYGQPPGVEKQPSIEVAIEARNDHLYEHRPIASPFAWRKCGLVTPVYPTMKAVVAHSQGSASDGIVTGYIWSGQPALPPPPNQAGDWWLSLPIDVDTTALPSDQTKLTRIDDWEKFDWTNFDKTKAVNDLTGPAGKRVIEIKGLKITVGASKLATVGTRPTEGPDDDFLIEHASGTSVHIDSNGVLTIDASKASLTIKGDVVIEGTLEIK